jgi:DNA-binding transcriptional regulator GbsR (MarR family)
MSSPLAKHFHNLAEEYQVVATEVDSFWSRIFNNANLLTKVQMLLLFDRRSWTISELSRELKVSGGHVSYCLRQLEKAGEAVCVNRKRWRAKILILE